MPYFGLIIWTRCVPGHCELVKIGDQSIDDHAVDLDARALRNDGEFPHDRRIAARSHADHNDAHSGNHNLIYPVWNDLLARIG
jgi:hypothetical protein